MNREELIERICVTTSCGTGCQECKRILNESLDEYEKYLADQFKETLVSKLEKPFPNIRKALNYEY